jgi:hypothetical protein
MAGNEFLEQDDGRSGPMKCGICAAASGEFSRGRMLERHDVRFYRCPSCGFIQTEKPYWLKEAYAEAITRADVGLFRRNLRQAKVAKAVIATFFQSDARFVDFGGGYGLLARLMRDAGFDFHRWDAHCDNLFARGFAAKPDGSFELLTAFELFEHLADPVAEVEHMLSFAPNIFFTTELIPEPVPAPSQWWYYGLDHGQHVSFYTKQSLYRLAERFSLHLVTDGRSRHLMTKEKVSPLLFQLVSKYKVAFLIDAVYRRKSLIPDDFRRFAGTTHGSDR